MFRDTSILVLPKSSPLVEEVRRVSNTANLSVVCDYKQLCRRPTVLASAKEILTQITTQITVVGRDLDLLIVQFGA